MKKGKELPLDPKAQFIMLLSYLFGEGVGETLAYERLSFQFSKRTGKVKSVHRDGKLLATYRSDGSIAMTLELARLLMKSEAFQGSVVKLAEGAEEFVAKGKSVFARHVVKAGDRIRPGSEVAVVDSQGRLIAIGRALLSGRMMESLDAGVAVKVRQGLSAELKRSKGNGEGDGASGGGDG